MSNQEQTPAYKQDGHWLRVLYNIMFYVIYKVVDLIIFAILVIQLVIATFSDKPNEKLQEFGSSLGVYVKQIVAFISFSSDEKPYPLGDWPKSSK